MVTSSQTMPRAASGSWKYVTRHSVRYGNADEAPRLALQAIKQVILMLEVAPGGTAPSGDEAQRVLAFFLSRHENDVISHPHPVVLMLASTFNMPNYGSTYACRQVQHDQDRKCAVLHVVSDGVFPISQQPEEPDTGATAAGGGHDELQHADAALRGGRHLRAVRRGHQPPAGTRGARCPQGPLCNNLECTADVTDQSI